MTYRAPRYTLPTGITFDPTLGFVGTTVDTTYSDPASTVTLSDQGSTAANTIALQNAIDAAAVASTGGTLILLPVGFDHNNFILRARGGDGGWIYIATFARNLLPPPQAGNVPGDRTSRIVPADAAYMPKTINIQDRNIGEDAMAVSCEAGAHHYRLVGLDITTDPTKGSANLVFLSVQNQISGGAEVPGTGMDNAANFPHHIGLDRCYLHGQPTRFDMLRAVWLDADDGFVVGCHIADVVNSNDDAQGVLMARAHGPHKVCNNYIEATGENIMIGGADARVAGVIASDIEIRANYGFKPLTWNPFHPSWDGQARAIKNTWEIKNAQRVLFEGNVGLNDWSGAGAQYYMVNFKTTNQDGGATWVETKDVTFCYNKLLNCFGGMSLAGAPEVNPVGAPTNRVDIYDNLIVHGAADTLGAGLGPATIALNGLGPNTAFRRNTVVGETAHVVFFTSTTTADAALTDNVLPRGTTWGGASGGIKGDGAFDPAPPNDGSAIFDAYCTTHTFQGNGFYDAAGGSTQQRASYTTAPDVNTLVDDLEAAVFEDSAAGNYRLASGVFAGVASDGGLPGANIDQIELATANVADGGAPPPPAGPLTYVPIAF